MDNTAVEIQLLVLINRLRRANGVIPLVMEASLNEAAAWMANDMATNNYVSHTDSFGRTPFTRFAVLGASNGAGENLAAGYPDAQDVFTSFNDDPSERSNMLRASYNTVGIARAYNPDSQWKYYWVVDFGRNSSNGTVNTNGTPGTVNTNGTTGTVNTNGTPGTVNTNRTINTPTTVTTSNTPGTNTANLSRPNARSRIFLADQPVSNGVFSHTIKIWLWIVLIVALLLLLFLIWKN